MSTVVVGIDASETAAEAARSAAALAAGLGVSLTLVIAHAAGRPFHIDVPVATVGMHLRVMKRSRPPTPSPCR